MIVCALSAELNARSVGNATQITAPAQAKNNKLANSLNLG